MLSHSVEVKLWSDMQNGEPSDKAAKETANNVSVDKHNKKKPQSVKQNKRETSVFNIWIDCEQSLSFPSVRWVAPFPPPFPTSFAYFRLFVSRVGFHEQKPTARSLTYGKTDQLCVKFLKYATLLVYLCF